MVKYFFLILFVLSSLVFLARFHIIGFGVYGDGLGYLAYDRSLVFDHDLNFKNEFSFWQKQYSLVSHQPRWVSQITVNNATGLVVNHWGVGSAILWLPLYFLGHLLALFLSLFKIPVLHNGYSWPYEFLVGEGNIALGVCGLYLLFGLGKKYVSAKISLCGIGFLVFGTNLLFYLMYEPVTSHVPSLFFMTTILVLWEKLRKSWNAKIALFLGLSSGLLVITRNQDMVLVLPLLLFLLYKYRSQTFLLWLGFFLALIPQLLVWQVLNGHFWQVSYLSGGEVGFFHLLPLHFLDVIFSFHHGLFLWSPLLLLALWGLKYFKDKTLKTLLFSSLVMEVILTASWSQWWQGASFGGRFFVSSLPLFFFGLISLLNKYKNKATPLIVMTVGYNIILFILFILKIVQ